MMYDIGLLEKVFNNSQFVYYGKTVYPEKKDIKELGLDNAIEEHDLIVLMCTEANLKEFPWGFHNQLYDLLFKEELEQFVQKHLDEILELENVIRNDDVWLGKIKQLGKDQNISIEKKIRENAVFMVRAKYD